MDTPKTPLTREQLTQQLIANLKEIDHNYPRCPNCGSTNIDTPSRQRRSLLSGVRMLLRMETAVMGTNFYTLIPACKHCSRGCKHGDGTWDEKSYDFS